MIKDPRSHAAYQSFTRHRALQDVPDLRRVHYLLNGPMTDAERDAREITKLQPNKADAAKLGIDVDRLIARLRDQSARLAKSKIMFDELGAIRGGETGRARVARFRGFSEMPSKEVRK